MQRVEGTEPGRHMITLYHHPMSAGSRAIRLLLSEYGEEPELVEENLWEGRTAFLEMNPAASLPVLVERDEPPVIGATVAAEYLDETIGTMKRNHRLYPEGSTRRAEMRRLVDWAFIKMEEEVTRYIVSEKVTKRLMPANAGGGVPDSAALRYSRNNMKYHMKYLGWLATTRKWMAGDKMTFADLAIASSLSVLDYLGEVEWTEDGALKDWYAKMKSRPSFRPLLAERLRGMPPVSHYVDLDF